MSWYVVGLQRITRFGIQIFELSEQMNTKLFAYSLTSNTILSIAICTVACYRLTCSCSYSTHDLLHKNLITCLYYKLTNCKVGMLTNQEVQVNKVTSNCTLYKSQVK